MSTLPIDVQGIDQAIVQLGVIIGLLQPVNSNYSIDLDWFKNPLLSLQKIPTERTNFLTLFRDLLGSAGDSPPGDKRKWYPITQKDKSTNCYVVLPADDTGTSSIVGLGMMHSYTEGSITITPYLYVPLFELPITGNPIITGQTKGQTNYPIEIGLDLKDTQEQFKSGNVSFDGLQFAGDVLFAGTGSSFQLNFLDLQPPGTKGTYSTIQEVLNSLPNVGSPKDWINAVLESQTVTGWLNQKIGSSNETPGLLLTALGLLQQPSKQSNQQYILGDLTKFTSQLPKTILETFFFTVLSKLASNDKPLIPLSGEGNGIYVVGESETGDSTDYGLRLQIADIDATSSSENGKSSSEEDNSANSPQIKLQLGQWLTGEDKNSDSWLNRAAPKLTTPDPGLALYLVQADNSNTPSFHPKLELVSLGLSFQGSNDKPLVDTKGVTLGGIEPRIYLSIDFEDPTTIPWGAAIRCDKLGLPLGSGLNSASSNNPVAQNLLDSGSDDNNEDKQDEDQQDEDQQPVNPTFSAAIAYSTTVNFQLYDSDGKAADTVWLPMQRAFGPLHCQKIGVGWQDAAKLLSFLYYGGVSLAGLDVELEGLSVAIPVTTPADLSSYQFALQGLDITLDTGPVEISGGLQETFDNNVPVYNGEALIKAGEFSISALGSYTTIDGNPSMFIFAFIDDPLGGPPPCFITGICGGFGYNRGLTIPPVDQIQTFPFVAGLTDPDQVGGKDATPADALAKIANIVPPTRGEDWLAIGLQFTSFELIQSHALLTVEFGKEFEIALLGLSTIKLPAEGSETFAYAEMELEVVLKPQEGEFSAIAVLTSNSFVLDRDCHLTGGFAFCLWFGDNPHANDFVLSIGGYHPHFTKPAWYPDLPRLGFNWAIDSSLSISGEAYFALTPSCVMGGGRLEALYQDGGLKAWFIAHADFLMSWKPFFYEVSIGISIGASYTFQLFGTQTIRVELGASLDLWGPPTGGTVEIDLYIVSVTVSFGPSQSSPPAISWADFQALLPHSKPTSQNALTSAQNDPNLQICHIRASDGLNKTSASGAWCIRADEFAFAVESAIPLIEVTLNNGANQSTTIQHPNTNNYFVGIRPMGIDQLTTSTLTLEITRSDGTVENLSQLWNWQTSERDVPEAMWGQPVDGPPPPAANLLPQRFVGLNQIQLNSNMLTPITVDAANAFGYVVLDEKQGSTNVLDYLPLSAATPSTNQSAQRNSNVLNIIGTTLTNAAVKTKRTNLFDALADLGVNAGSNGDLSDVQQNVSLNYQALPMVGTPDGIATS